MRRLRLIEGLGTGALAMGVLGCKQECEVTGAWSSSPELPVNHSSTTTWRGVATSQDVSCAWDDEAVFCWENVTLRVQDPDPLVLTEMAISPAGSWAVGLRDTGALAWFDPARPDLGISGSEDGPYKDLWAGSTYMCLVTDADDAALCGQTSSQDRVGPEGLAVVRAVGDDEGHFCGLGLDRTVSCWDEAGGPLDLGFGTTRYADLDGARGQICAIPVDAGTPVCAGTDTSSADATPEDSCGLPSAAFASIAVGDKTACALDADGLAHCWQGNLAMPAPTDAFAELSIAPNHACGLGTDGSLTCFGAISDTMSYLP